MGRLYTTDGLVIRTYPRGENDRLIQILTPNKGKLSAIVRHGQTGRDRLAAVSQPFTWGNFELSESHGALWLRSGSILSSFYSLSCNLTHMALASYLCDLSGDVVGTADTATPESEQEECPDAMAQFGGRMLRMLLNSLYTLEQGTKLPAQIKGVFEMRTAAMAGFCPFLGGCSVCGEAAPAVSFLDVMNGRLLCEACKARLNRGGLAVPAEEELGERSILIPLSGSVLAAIRYALAAPDRKIFAFSLEASEAEAFSSATETYLLNHLEHGFETLNFYSSVASTAGHAIV